MGLRFGFEQFTVHGEIHPSAHAALSFSPFLFWNPALNFCSVRRSKIVYPRSEGTFKSLNREE
jgi:hypothetical protein